MVVTGSDRSSSGVVAMVKRFIASTFLWPCIILLPLVLTHNDLYKKVFPSQWYDSQAEDYWYRSDKVWPSPLGLSLGLLAVSVGQVFTLIYFILWKSGSLGLEHLAVQKTGAPAYVLWEGLVDHLSQPEGFLMLGGYLTGTWMLGLMPSSYYSFSGGINFFHVAMQLLITDFIQYVMHKLEHD
eukprot:gene33149-40107_t